MSDYKELTKCLKCKELPAKCECGNEQQAGPYRIKQFGGRWLVVTHDTGLASIDLKEVADEVCRKLNAQHRQIEEQAAEIERLRGALAVYENPPEMRAVPKRKITVRGKIKHVGKLRPRQIEDEADHANE